MKRIAMFAAPLFAAGITFTAYTVAGTTLNLRSATFTAVTAGAAGMGPFGLPQLSDESRECINCHRKESPAVYQSWGDSRHYRANVGCYECHSADKNDSDAYLHYDRWIATIVSPKDCARCHSKEVEEFTASRHAHAGDIFGTLDLHLAETVAGNRGMRTMGSPSGASAAVVTGCLQCHGSEVKVLPNGKLDPATWPNAGIGRINPDGSVGSCSACHTRHTFSASEARHPQTCSKCHLGPDHPQKEVYESSKHGIAFATAIDRMNMNSPKWVVGEDYSAAPTCSTCHMSATRNQPVTHDVGQRISWHNRPELSIRPEEADAKIQLPGAGVHWQTRRANMRDVCLNCHSRQWVDNFYMQYDATIELYNEKFARPGLELYTLAKPLLKQIEFGNKLDFTWYELWHSHGRQVRHGAAMMGASTTNGGTYELARQFYNDFIPQLRELIEANLTSPDADRVRAAEALQAKLHAVLNSEDHKWYSGRSSADDAARRSRPPSDRRSSQEN